MELIVDLDGGIHEVFSKKEVEENLLTELQLEIKEQFNDRPFSYNHHQRTEFYRDVDQIIQSKIDALKGSNSNDTQ